MASTPRIIEVLANISIILLAGIVGFTYVRQQHSRPIPQAPPEVAVGEVANIGGVSADHSKTLVLALSIECRYCDQSATFHRRLASAFENSRRLHLRAIFPQPQAKLTLSGI
jgi:hypothetical protein